MQIQYLAIMLANYVAKQGIMSYSYSKVWSIEYS